MAGPRILTFNFHEPYLCLLAKTGYDFTVGLFDELPLRRDWLTSFRPVPPNISFVDEKTWRDDACEGRYDLIIAQNPTNALEVFRSVGPAILLCHNRRTFMETTIPKEKALQHSTASRIIDRLQERFSFVFISESKRDDYGVPGRVILPGIDVEEYGGYTGEERQVLRVGNAMRERSIMFDVDLQERACEGLPNQIVGMNPALPASKQTSSFDELLSFYRTRRCLLHVTQEAYEDGYNLSMLEAMGTGMPVVALANKSCPITDGHDGFIGADAEALHARLAELLDHQALAQELGARGRETVAQRFPISAFVESWREAIEEALETAPRGLYRTRQPHRLPQGVEELPRVRLLLEYVAYPITTARYFEWALRREHEVVTAGYRVPEEVLLRWGFPEIMPRYPEHDVPLPLEAPYADMRNGLPDTFTPDVFLHIDSGKKQLAPDMDVLEIPKMAYLIDTHIDLETRLVMAHRFDVIFLAQKAYVPLFEKAGIPNVHWVPLACCPELYSSHPRERHLDVSFVGRIVDGNVRRKELLEAVADRFPKHFIGRRWPYEMAQTYQQSKIVVNIAINNDVNMRVFEAMAAGALLITDDAYGLEDLFVDGEHLVVYRKDEDLLDTIQRYLDDTETRERIAAAGQALVLAKHTYAHRVDSMLLNLLEDLDHYGGAQGESRFHTGGYYRSPRPELMPHIPAAAKRILDIGCGGGDFGQCLKQRGAEYVVGVEVVERAWEQARHLLDEAILGNIETMDLPFHPNSFDCIVCADVLEHLREPKEALEKLLPLLAPGGRLVASIPNVRFCSVVQALAEKGRWQYEDAGILDRTHLRFFTAVEMKALFDEAGYELTSLAPLSMLARDQLPRDGNGTVRLGRLSLDGVSDAEYNDLLTYQYLVIATRPEGGMLDRAQSALDGGRNEEAYDLAHRATDAEPYERQRLLGTAAGRLGLLEKAAVYYRRALEARPEDVPVRAELGILLVAMNQGGEAQALLNAVAQHTDGDLRARVLGAKGLLALAQGDAKNAIRLFQASLEDNFDSQMVLTRLLETARDAGRPEEAEPHWRRYCDFYPGNLTMLTTYARLLGDIGQVAEARERLETVLLFAPDHEEARAALEQLPEA
jgi:2-polyprenyl-3-methyl-5-hydroxy-6-metoxy-1,4-benzoquinol methylase/Tfp pilus assembly protein PilF